VADQKTLDLTQRSRELTIDARGFSVWKTAISQWKISPSETALVLCDVWDKHWCRGANDRLAKLLHGMNHLARVLREMEVLIVHAPSDTIDFYRDSPARRRALEAPPIEVPPPILHEDPPLPIDDSDGGCDTTDNPGVWGEALWTRQHPAIRIDEETDVISDDARELYSLFHSRGVRNVLIMGVHTNMCMLNRSFGIKQMVRWGFHVALVRELTDSMYNPAKPPYVNHDDGTRLVIEYIEKFWCPTVSAKDLAKSARAPR
jgi:nicotinamidase-related amidase